VPEAAGAGSSSSSKAQQKQQTQDRDGCGLSGASKSQLLHAQHMGLVVLTQRWLADSISSMKLLPLQGYRFSC
jgi:hypothetical protein